MVASSHQLRLHSALISLFKSSTQTINTQQMKKQSQTTKRTKQGLGSTPFTKGVAGAQRGQRPFVAPAGAKSPYRVSSAQGEFENSPADCFQRGAYPAIEGCPLLAYRTNFPARACPLRPHRSGVLGRTALFVTLGKLAVYCRGCYFCARKKPSADFYLNLL